jgi:hypothetical protein
MVGRGLRLRDLEGGRGGMMVERVGGCDMYESCSLWKGRELRVVEDFDWTRMNNL